MRVDPEFQASSDLRFMNVLPLPFFSIFRMYEDGSWWEPPLPPHQMYTAMPRSLYHTSFMVPRPEVQEREIEGFEREIKQRERKRTKERERKKENMCGSLFSIIAE